MSRFGKYTTTLLRLMLFIGLLIVFAIPVRSWVSAQNSSAPVWVVRSLKTSEYRVDNPTGLAFSPEANTFLILDGSADVTLVTMGEEPAGTRNIPEVQNDSLDAAFDAQTGSLFVFNHSKAELVQIRTAGKGSSARFGVNAFGVTDPRGLAFDPADGRMFILDAGNAQILSLAPHPTQGFDSKTVQHVSLKKLGNGSFKGLAYNPVNGHFYVSEAGQKKLYELTQSGDLVASVDLAALGISNPTAMTFAPSVDNTDDPNIQDLFILDTDVVSSQQGEPSHSQIIELSLQAPAALPPGTTLLPTTLVHIIDTSKAAWNPSAPDPAGVDYWPLTGSLLIGDSEVDEMPPYFVGKNVYQSTTSGVLTSTCSTTSFSNEPTGVAINPNNNHIFFSDDSGSNDKVFEVSLGADGKYCTADDTVSITNVGSLYGVLDAEDVAYGNNTLFIAGGSAAEVYRIPLGANGVLGGGDDGTMAHFDTARLGFSALEGLGYNANAGTLFIVSPQGSEKYLGETTTTGSLLRAYNLGYSGLVHLEDVTYAPGSQNAAVKNIYLTDRGVDNDTNRLENDGKVWEISLGSTPAIPTPSRTPTTVPPNASTWFLRGIGSFVFGTNGDIPVPADYNGDGKDDLAVFQPSSSTWTINGVGSLVYGLAGDIPVPADYNGDGKADIAIYRPSNRTWAINGVGSLVYGLTGDMPVPADYNGDGKADIAVFRPSNSTWSINGVGSFLYGTSGDIPVVGDYNGDRINDIAVFRPSKSTWYIRGIGSFLYGTRGDIPVVGDYNGDGRDDIAVFRPSNSTWYIRGIGSFRYGASGDKPVVGDYNGDGIDDIAVFRP